METTNNKEKYKLALLKWKTDNNLCWFARMPQKPEYRKGWDATDYAKRLAIWNQMKSLWQTAPKPEDYGLACLLNEHFEIRIGLYICFGAQHVKLFNYRLLSELDEFELFLYKNGFRYDYIEKQDGSIEIDIDSSYDFIFSNKSAKFRLAIGSSDGVHITQFYFYNDKGYKDESQRVNTIADMHDFFMKDKRVVTKKIKADKGCHNFIQDYIAPYEVARIEDDRFYIVTSEEYKKLPKYRWPNIKSGLVLFPILAFFYFGPAIYGLFSKEEATATKMFDSANQTESVYICTGPKSKSYHKEQNCYGLKSCSAEVEEIPIGEAEDQGRHPCRYCSKEMSLSDYAIKNRKKLYNNLLNDGFDLGSFDDFNINIDNTETRKQIYDAASESGWELHSYRQFEKDMGIR